MTRCSVCGSKECCGAEMENEIENLEGVIKSLTIEIAGKDEVIKVLGDDIKYYKEILSDKGG